MSKRLDDSWQNWSKPINMGPILNTKSSESFYTIPADGEYAFFVKNGDIYKLKLSDSQKPDPVVLIEGKVLDKKTNKPLEADISYYDLEKNEEVGLATSDPITGNYKIVLPYGINYGFTAKRKGYYAISEHINLKETSEHKEIEKDIYMSPIIVGQSIVLRNIFFEFDKAVLLNESLVELDLLVDILNKNPKIKIEIGGHTDDKGSNEYNKTLSKERAEAVSAYLIQNNIDTSRVSAIGYGETKPIVVNDSEENRDLNRRVEFKIVSNK